MDERHDRLRRARIAAGFDQANEAAERHGWNPNTYKSNENGNAPFSFRKAKEYALAFGVRAEWLYDALGPIKNGDEQFVPIIGRVGADPEGTIIQSTGQASYDLAPQLPTGVRAAAALEVVGDSMPWFAENGSLVYIESQHREPTPEMLYNYCVVETDERPEGRVLVKRLLRGSEPGMWTLLSQVGPPIENVRLRWAAEPVATVKPRHARAIIKRGSEVA